MNIEEFIIAYHIHILIWLGIFLISLILEFASKKTISLWFSVGAIGGMLLSMLKLSFTIQFASFIIISVGLILLNVLSFSKIEQNNMEE